MRSNGAVLSKTHAETALGAPTAQRALAARRACSIVCMAHPRRVAKVAKQIEREVGQLLISDKTLQAAVCPERRRGFDGALSALASVTEVVISNDLQVAKVYLSIYSDDLGKVAAMEGLQRLEGYVRKHVGKQVRLRLTPEIRFVLDDSIERTERIYKLLDQVKKIERGEAEPPPLAFYGDLEDEEDGWEDSDSEDDSVFETVDLGMFGGNSEAAAPSSAKGGGPSQRQQQQQASGGGSGRASQAAVAGSGSAPPQQQQQRQAVKQQPRPRRLSQDTKEDAVQDEEEMAEMLAMFKQQAQRRRLEQQQ
ncbi:hypothetical protein D9Q98_005557 [Chlorella vulgaris]|uniref:Ribosome-binding factor A n=1 Tax=Chlorella vulgaris TaxID=3077 RepID=A0A9D4TMX1_CHLVU|nr:hypothetical protein D9Q98_005557 [Chlorella vulgaris]